MRALITIIALALSACAAPQRLEGGGDAAAQPFGHGLACAKNPNLPNCPK